MPALFPGLPALLAPGAALNWAWSVNAGLVFRYLGLPAMVGGTRWVELVAGGVATLTNMASPPTATSGPGATTRPGGWGDVGFDGTDDYANLGNPTVLQDVRQKTISCWLYVTSASSGGSLARLLDKQTAGGWFVQIDNADVTSGVAFFQEFSTTGGKWCTPANGATVGSWAHYVITYDSNSTGNTPIFYRNGVALAAPSVVTVAAGSYVSDVSSTLYFGDTASGLRCFQGFMDDVCLWNRLLSPAEVLHLYADTLSGSPWSLNWQAPLSMIPQAFVPDDEQPWLYYFREVA